jgi:hypothetical protein
VCAALVNGKRHFFSIKNNDSWIDPAERESVSLFFCWSICFLLSRARSDRTNHVDSLTEEQNGNNTDKINELCPVVRHLTRLLKFIKMVSLSDIQPASRKKIVENIPNKLSRAAVGGDCGEETANVEARGKISTVKSAAPSIMKKWLN